MTRATLLIVLLIASLFLTSFSFKELHAVHSHYPDESVATEGLYLPKLEALEIVSFASRNVLAHVLWFNTVNYFGKHFRGDKNYTWLAHMCKTTTALNPKASHIFEFCGLMLSWEAGKHNLADDILRDYEKAYPQEWRPLYLQGMAAAIFSKDAHKAKELFLRAAKLPNAPAFVARLASDKIASLEDPDMAIAFLRSMIKRSSDENQKKALKKKLKKLKKKKKKLLAEQHESTRN